MSLSRSTPEGWLEETGELSRSTPFGWVEESQGNEGGNDSLTASGITSGAPSVGTPSITQNHAFAASSITSGFPVLGQPSIPTDGNHDLTASGIDAAPPVVGSPVLTALQGILGANIPSEGEHGGSPVLNDFDVDPAAQYYWEVDTWPSAGVLEIFSDLTFTWDAFGVADGDYTWVYRLWENGIPGGTATVYMTVGAIVANGITAGAPVIGSPALTQEYALSAASIVSGVPTVEQPDRIQNHALAGASIESGAPALGTPMLTDIPAGTMTAEHITAGAPTVGSPTITQNHALGAGAIAAGAPVFGPVTLEQQHALMAGGVTAGSPVVGSPTLTENAGTETWPAESDVRLGVTYGPTGAEYTGAMAEGGGSYPTAEQIAAAVDTLLASKFAAIPTNVWAKELP